jgi:hypothetical protein
MKNKVYELKEEVLDDLNFDIGETVSKILKEKYKDLRAAEQTVRVIKKDIEEFENLDIDDIDLEDYE